MTLEPAESAGGHRPTRERSRERRRCRRHLRAERLVRGRSGSGELPLGDSFLLSYIDKPSDTDTPADIDYFRLPGTGGDTGRNPTHVHTRSSAQGLRPRRLRPSSGALRPAPSSPLDGQPVGDQAPTLTNVNESLAAPTLDYIPLAFRPSSPGSCLWACRPRGTETDAVTVVVAGHRGGGVHRPGQRLQPRRERQAVQLPQPASRSRFRSPCPNPDFAYPQLDLSPQDRAVAEQAPTSDITSVPAVIPATADTLFVVNRSHVDPLVPGRPLSTTYYSGQQTRAIRRPVCSSFFPSSAPAGNPAAAVLIDGDPGRAQSLQRDGTRAQPAPLVRNRVVSAVNAKIEAARAAHPAIKNVVLVGGDEIIPFARLDDLTNFANESGYENATVAKTPAAWALRAGMMLSDDPYGDVHPTPYLGRQLHVPEVAVGRLVETPSIIKAQLGAFVAKNGVLDPRGR